MKDFGLRPKDVIYRRMDWPSRDSTVHLHPNFQRPGNPSLRWDGLPIRGKLTGRHNVGCGWANPSYIFQCKIPSRRYRKRTGLGRRRWRHECVQTEEPVIRHRGIMF